MNRLVAIAVLSLSWCQPLALGFSSTTTFQSKPWTTVSVQQQPRQFAPSSPSRQPLFMTEAAETDEVPRITIRQRLRKATGFSFTALRNTLRAATGFSFTALRASLRAATGISLTAIRISVVASTSSVVRNTMKFTLSPFPDWSRFFAQPFLVAYYGPLIAVKMHPTEGALKERLAKHDAFREDMKDAVRTAVAAQDGGYWPVEVNGEGEIVAVAPAGGDASSIDIGAAIAESFQVARSLEATATDE